MQHLPADQRTRLYTEDELTEQARALLYIEFGPTGGLSNAQMVGLSRVIGRMCMVMQHKMDCLAQDAERMAFPGEPLDRERAHAEREHASA